MLQRPAENACEEGVGLCHVELGILRSEHLAKTVNHMPIDIVFWNLVHATALRSPATHCWKRSKSMLPPDSTSPILRPLSPDRSFTAAASAAAPAPSARLCVSVQ